MEFKETLGHHKQKNQLLNAFEQTSLAHAYALCGPENIGKTTFALDFVKNVLGADPVLDLFVFDEDKDFVVEEVRRLREIMALTSAGRYKAAVIAHAQKLSSSTANALLKILEEPPTGSIFILTCENFSGLLPTIASRLQRINFAPLTESEMMDFVTRSTLGEEKTLEILKLAGGRSGIAFRLAADDKLYIFLEECHAYFETLESGSLLERFKSAEVVASWEGEQIEMFLKTMMRIWTERLTPKRLGERLMIAFRDLRYNVNIKLIMDNLFI